MRESHTAVIERNVTWEGTFATEPYEVAWAGEALFFVRVLDRTHPPDRLAAYVQLSPDGIHWCNEGTVLPIPMTGENELAFCRVDHFGGWLRLTGEVPEGASVTVIAYLVLKE